MASGTPASRKTHDVEATAWFYQHSGDGFAVAKEGRLVSVNPAWCAILGATDEEMLGVHVIKLVHIDDRAEFLDAVARLETQGEASIEHRLRRQNGAIAWVRAAVKRGQDGLYMIVLRDVSAEREARLEAELAANSTDLLRASAGVYLWKFDPDTNQYTVEAAATDNSISRGTANVSTGQMSDSIHPDDLRGFGAVFLPTIQTGEAADHIYRYRVTRPDGSQHWARYRTAWRGVRKGESGKWEIRGLTQDITEMAEARDAALRGEQAAKAAAEAKAHFLANMSHEIRTPLNGVLGVLHLLKGEGLSLGGGDLVEQALACGGMLTQLLNDVLDLSKIEAGKLELHPEPLDPVSALQGVVEMMRPGAEAKGLYLRTVVEGEPGWVSADPVRLRQVLFNLIGNASKFTLEGGVEVRLKAIGAGERQRLRIEVEDTGVGVAEEAIAALFERFHQADGSTTRRFGGTGLGLAITRSLVEQMDGEVDATSQPGHGSTFWFEIAAPAAEPAGQAADADSVYLEGLRVLVVEDNATNRLIARRMLESLGAVVTTAEDGAVGVEMAAHQAFDLIFMDIQMPGMDGVEATRLIRALGGAAAATPIVAMTANVMKHQIREYLAAGMDGAVAKPLSPSDILAELARLSAAEAEPISAVA